MARAISKILAAATPTRRWTQFSLGTMLLAVTVTCIWLADYVRPVRRLERQLRDPAEEERVVAARRLGYLGPDARSATNALLRSMEDGSAEVRATAAWAVSRVSGRPELLLPFLAAADEDVKLAAAEGFLWAGGDPLKLFSIMLADDSFASSETDELASLLGPLEAAGVLPLLLDSLASENDFTREQAGYCLQRLAVPAPGAAPALIGRLADDRAAVRTAAAEQLLLLPPPLARQAAPALRNALCDPDARASAAMAAALGAIEPDDKVFAGVLRRSLRSDDPQLVERAFYYVWRLGPAAADVSGDLAQALCDPRCPSLSGYGELALERLGPRAARAAKRLEREVKQALTARQRIRLLPEAQREQLKSIGAVAIRLCGALVRSRGGTTPSRQSALAGHGAVCHLCRRAMSLLQRALEHVAATAMPEMPLERLNCLAAVAPPERSLPILIDALDDGRLRAHAVFALGSIGNDAAPAIARLLPLLESNDLSLRRDVFRAIAKVRRCDENARMRLRAFLGTADPKERFQAALALAALGEPAGRIVQTLVHGAIDSGWLGAGEELCAAITSIGPAAVPELLVALRSPEPKVRRAAATALGELGPAAAPSVALLMQLLDESGAREAAAEALGHIGKRARAAVPKLLALLEAARLRGASEEYVPLLHALGGIGRDAADALPAVLRLADLDDPEIRHPAVIALAAIDPDNRSLMRRLRRLLLECERKSAISVDQRLYAECDYLMPHSAMAQIAEVVWQVGARADPLAAELRRIVSAPLLDPRVRGYAAFALASFPAERSTATEILQNLAFRDHAFYSQLARQLVLQISVPTGSRPPLESLERYGVASPAAP